MTLVLENVKKNYKKFNLDVTMTLETGCVTGLIGKNGAGKSTTFKAILGLIRLDGGKVTLDGKDMTKLTVAQKEEIGVVLADSCFSEYMTVKDAIAVMAAMYHKFNRQDFVDQCEHFQIPLNQKIKEFSTGMKAKLKVLLAMSHDAKLLIMDEPTAGLDVVARDEILDMLRDYMETGDRSILISSHISSDLEGLCDDIYLIDEGKIVMHEETDVLVGEYGVLKLTDEQYNSLDKTHILCTKQGRYGYECLTNQKQFYMENCPGAVIERGSIDEVITLMIGSKKEAK